MNNNIKILYDQVTPETSAEELSERIISGRAQPKTKQHHISFISVFAVAAAGIVLTVAAGAAGILDFSDFFSNIFGGKTENMQENIVDYENIKVVTETFDDYDFTVTGLAVDNNLIYLGLDINAVGDVSLKERYQEDEMNFDVYYCSEDGESFNGNIDPLDCSDKCVSLLVTFYVDKLGDKGGTLGIENMYASYNTLPATVEDGVYSNPYHIEERVVSAKGKWEIEFNPNNLNSIEIHDVQTCNMTYRRFIDNSEIAVEKELEVSKIFVSNLSVLLNYKTSYTPHITEYLDDRKTYALLDDGSKIALNFKRSDEEISDTTYGEVCNGIMFFTMREPVDIHEISAIVFGDTVISL